MHLVVRSRCRKRRDPPQLLRPSPKLAAQYAADGGRLDGGGALPAAGPRSPCTSSAFSQALLGVVVGHGSVRYRPHAVDPLVADALMETFFIEGRTGP